MSVGFYGCGEAITKNRIQDEDWYSDYQVVSEVMCAGPDDHNSFFERLPDGFERAKQACYAYFNRCPGPPGWSPPDETRLERWLRSMWLTEEVMQQIDKLREEEEKARKR
jgi:hypothetical protein